MKEFKKNFVKADLYFDKANVLLIITELPYHRCPRAPAWVEILSARRNDAQKDWERKTEKGAKKNNYFLQYNSSRFVLLKRVVKQLHTSAQIGFL